VLLGVVVYRAKTQSFTIDEAFTFNLFIDRDLTQFALVYDACNHVLHTLLTKFVRYWLGTSELVLRLVSIGGAILYFIAARRLCRLAAGSGWTPVIGLAALALNPLILDFLVAARGYGLAVALFLWSVYYSVRWVNEGGNGGREVALLRRAGLAAGLSIAANLTLLVPAASLGLILFVLSLRRGTAGAWSVIDRFGGPAVVTAFLLVVIPLARSTPDNFYLGTKTMDDALASLWDASFFYDRARSPFSGCEACVVEGRQTALPAAFILFTAGGAAWLFYRLRSRSADLTADLFVICSMSLAFSVVMLAALHRFYNVPLPYGRSGLYLIPLFTLSVLAGAQLMIRSRLFFRTGGYALAGFLALSALVFAAQLNTRYFAEWKFDASTKRLMAHIASERRRQLSSPFVLASSGIYEQTLKYYRKRNRLHDMAPDIVTTELEKSTAEYFVLAASDRDLVQRLGLKTITEDDLSGAIVARR
jgi:hypothetical protein